MNIEWKFDDDDECGFRCMCVNGSPSARFPAPDVHNPGAHTEPPVFEKVEASRLLARSCNRTFIVRLLGPDLITRVLILSRSIATRHAQKTLPVS